MMSWWVVFGNLMDMSESYNVWKLVFAAQVFLQTWFSVIQLWCGCQLVNHVLPESGGTQKGYKVGCFFVGHFKENTCGRMHMFPFTPLDRDDDDDDHDCHLTHIFIFKWLEPPACGVERLAPTNGFFATQLWFRAELPSCIQNLRKNDHIWTSSAFLGYVLNN